jgi:hypothetical protein
MPPPTERPAFFRLPPTLIADYAPTAANTKLGVTFG